MTPEIAADLLDFARWRGWNCWGIDPGATLATTGVAMVDRDGLTITDGEDVADHRAYWARNDSGGRHVWIEYWPGGTMGNAQVMALSESAGIVRYALVDVEDPTGRVAPATWRKTTLGRGVGLKSAEWKRRSMEFAQATMAIARGAVPITHDQADALCILVHGLSTITREIKK